MAIAFDAAVSFDSDAYTFDGVAIVLPVEVYKKVAFASDGRAAFITNMRAAFTSDGRANFTE